MRRRNSAFIGLLNFAVKLPWWGGLLLAVVTYTILHWFASMEAPALVLGTGQDGKPANVGLFTVGTLFKTLATFLQYIIPFIFTIAGIGAGIKSIMRSSEYGRVESVGLRAVADLSWGAFERLVGEAFRRKGYSVVETNKGPDGGIDLILRRDGEEHLVQCKHWRANKVGVNVIRELHGVMASRGAASGFVVTAGDFTSSAKNYAQGRNIELIGTHQFKQLLDEGRKGTGSASHLAKTLPSTDTGVAVPDCPKCGTAMIERIAKRGTNIGGRFWGCKNFPKCRKTLPISPVR